MDLSLWTHCWLCVNRWLLPGGKSVQRSKQTLITDRASWLAHLSHTLSEAQQILFELDLSRVCRSDVGELFHRIEAAQMEVRSLQISRSAHPREQKPPEWPFLSPSDEAQGAR